MPVSPGLNDREPAFDETAAAAGPAALDKHTDREMRAKTANLFHVRGDKVTRLVAYYDRKRALVDLGLEG